MSLGCDDDDPEDVVTTRSSATADFTSYETFAFPERTETIEDLDESVPTQVAANLELVNDAVRSELTALGLEEVDAADDPDLVAFNLAATEETEAISWECVDGYWYGYWTYAWDPCAWLAPIYTEYTSGAVLVALADRQREEVVFGGLIQGVGDDEDPDEVEERVQNGVAAIFNAYPSTQTGD
jgi:hypothetical protein